MKHSPCGTSNCTKSNLREKFFRHKLPEYKAGKMMHCTVYSDSCSVAENGDMLLLCMQLAKKKGNVFATDAILATLMCAPRSNYSWDIVVQKVGNKLFFDKRDDSEFGRYTT